nr:hypothetical protein [Tanacetum cinerariifolium]
YDEEQESRLSEEERIQEEEDADELYRDVNINQGKGLQVTQIVEDTHVILTPVNPDGPQKSSSMQTNQFTEAVSAIPCIVHQYMDQQMKETVREAVQIQTDRLQDSLQRENDEFLCNIDENMKKVLKGLVKNQVKEQVSCILPRIEEFVNATLEAEVLTRSSYSSKTSYVIAADLSEMELKKILIEKMEGNKQKEGGEQASASTPSEKATEGAGGSKTGSQSRQMSASESAYAEEPPRRPPSSDRAWNTALPAAQGDAQSWISDLAKQADARSSFNELLNTPIEFSNFIMQRLNVDTLTPDLLAGPTYELMRGSCTRLTELEYHLEEVYKATTDQLDWVNLEGQQYPHNLLQPLPLIPDNRGRRVILFEHFINNDLEYLRRGDVKHIRLIQTLEDSSTRIRTRKTD